MATPNPTRQEVTRAILKRYFQRWLTRISMDEIFPHIYLGGSYAAENISTLTTKNISFVISIMSKNLPPSTREAYMDKRIEHVYIKKRDDSDEDILAVLGEVCALIEKKSQGGKGVLLHCAMGVSRSATIMAAYVMQRWGISGTEAVNFIRNKRHVVQPNRGFCEQLDVWESCRYEVFTAERVPKEAYELWRKRVERERAEERDNAGNAEVDNADTGAS
ncbi:hypothetical protein JMJ35_005888 [Cladonia borealis]|uniref:protein-tyrosine-phosphatase n=1 Tax=Cladonia borealis TaxID=184061 RepID=A0AA39QY39_9LECA|nr:hypothetical protein JMJ35_005888 [Cladonia borealis]